MWVVHGRINGANMRRGPVRCVGLCQPLPDVPARLLRAVRNCSAGWTCVQTRVYRPWMCCACSACPSMLAHAMAPPKLPACAQPCRPGALAGQAIPCCSSCWLQGPRLLRCAVAHLDDHLVQLLLVALHLAVLLDLHDGDVLLVPQRDDLVKGEDEVEGISAHGLLLKRLAELRHQLRQQAQRLQVLQNVTLLVGDDQQVEALRRGVCVQAQVSTPQLLRSRGGPVP